MKQRRPERRLVRYDKWGYIFIAPFFAAFILFTLVPLIQTIYFSFFEYYRSGLKVIGPSYVGLSNYQKLFASDIARYGGNTLAIWLMGFIPQIAVSLLLASWFTNTRLRLRGQGFL